MHPNIVTAFDAGVHGKTYYLVMEYIDGVTLASYVRTKGPLSVGRAASLIAQAASGINYAHRQGIVHRDVKPSNIMLARDNLVKILDMGLAAVKDVTVQGTAQSSGFVTDHGLVIGTAGYISPEQISDSHEVDHRADIYSLGCTLHYLLTG